MTSRALHPEPFPWANRYELNCHEYDRVRADLVDAEGVDVVRYWPRGDYEADVDARRPER